MDVDPTDRRGGPAALVCFALLAGRFPNRNLFEFAPLLLGRWLGNTLTAFYVLHFTLTACVILLLEMRFVDLWLLPFNSPWPVILANFAVLAFFVRQKIAVIARYYTLILFLIVVLVILMLIGSDHGDYRFLLPVGQSGWLPVTGGMKSALMSFLGFEFFLVVCGDANARGRSLMTPLFWSNLAISVFYLMIVVICDLYFSPEMMRQTPQPVPFYLSGISLPFLERLDLIFLSVWLVKVTATLTAYLYGAAKGASTLPIGAHRTAVLYLAPLVCATAFFWRSEKNVQLLVKAVDYTSFAVLAFPVLLLALAALLGRKELSPT